MRFKAFLLCCALFAGQPPARTSDAEDLRIQQIRRRLDSLTEQHAKALIDEQPSPGDQADAALVIGALHELGTLGNANPVLAERYYRLAAQLGSPEAECALGNFLSVGVEGPNGRIARDFPKALEHYRRAAAGGSVKAMLRLGEIYSEGGEVAADSRQALDYFMEAARRGDEDAIQKLEPVMRQAREWEAARPGRQANFPTSREALIDSSLVREEQRRTFYLNRKASRLYVELNRRIGASTREDAP
ncbi:MAG: sel1 repeat family protein [Planctomycetes bacterium]|nr:sel1 repeat family protein [Planctomycetota bacterium]